MPLEIVQIYLLKETDVDGKKYFWCVYTWKQCFQKWYTIVVNRTLTHIWWKTWPCVQINLELVFLNSPFRLSGFFLKAFKKAFRDSKCLKMRFSFRTFPLVIFPTHCLPKHYRVRSKDSWSIKTIKIFSISQRNLIATEVL